MQPTDNVTYWHGGGRIEGDMVLPSNVTGNIRSGDYGVFVTTERALAECYASTVDQPTAWVYEVEPLGDLEPIPPLIFDRPVISYRCEAARIVGRFTISKAARARYRSVVAKAAVDLDAGKWQLPDWSSGSKPAR